MASAAAPHCLVLGVARVAKFMLAIDGASAQVDLLQVKDVERFEERIHIPTFADSYTLVDLAKMVIEITLNLLRIGKR